MFLSYTCYVHQFTKLSWFYEILISFGKDLAKSFKFEDTKDDKFLSQARKQFYFELSEICFYLVNFYICYADWHFCIVVYFCM